MPGPDTLYAADGPDLYPKDREQHDYLVRQLVQAFDEADRARQPHYDKWKRYYRLYRSHVTRQAGDWRSKVFIPMVFWTVETITPRLVAQLPKMLVAPVEASDVEPAKVMEEALGYCAGRTDLFLELVKVYKSALKYGTGIVKTFYDRRQRMTRVREPVLEPVMAGQRVPLMDPDTNLPLRDPDGNEVVDEQEVEVGQRHAVDPETGEPRYEVRRVPKVLYDGPASQWVDIGNFWPAPGATDMDDAAYVIQRVYRSPDYVEAKIREKVFRLPEGAEVKALLSGDDEDPASERLEEVDLEGGGRQDRLSRQIELLEFWTDDRVITLAGRRFVLRVAENPFDHGEKPFARVVDHLVEGEFWGIGEIEPLEGDQDLLNALWNARVDNVRLLLNAMFIGHTDALMDMRDLQVRPGGVIRLSGNPTGARPSEVIERLDLGDVTSSSYTEAAEAERIGEKVSGVSAYQTGTDSPTLNDTATGVALISEQGNSRFALKTAIAEMTGLKRIARHFGSIIEQFWTEQRTIRILGPRGQYLWMPFQPEDFTGGLDYDIETASSTQTETVRREQAISLFQMLAGPLQNAQPLVDPATGQPIPGTGLTPGVQALIEDVLLAFGHKDLDRYFGFGEATPAALPQPGQADLMGSLGPMQGVPA